MSDHAPNATVPAPDAVTNTLVKEVIGNKADAASAGAGTASLVALHRQTLANLATVDGFADVPAPDAVTNAQSRDVVGNKSDAASEGAGTASLVALARQILANLDVVGDGKVITCRPGAAAGGAVMTAGAAGVAGAYAQVDDGTGVPAGAFRVVGFSLDTPSAGMVGQIDIASGAPAAEVIVASIPFEIATDAAVMPTVHIPPSGQIAGATRIAARLTTVAGAHTLGVKLWLQPV